MYIVYTIAELQYATRLRDHHIVFGCSLAITINLHSHLTYLKRDGSDKLYRSISVYIYYIGSGSRVVSIVANRERVFSIIIPSGNYIH